MSSGYSRYTAAPGTGPLPTEDVDCVDNTPKCTRYTVGVRMYKVCQGRIQDFGKGGGGGSGTC